MPHTSFPALLGDYFLKDRTSIVVSGTHGKTTTTSILAWVLHDLGEEPSFLICGVPRNFPRSFELGKGKLFAIEGDEYDTAFFDKGPKFLHYHPKHLIFNNLEFDHADIYHNVQEIDDQFAKLLRLVKNPRNILANVDDEGVRRVLKQTGLEQAVTSVSTLGQDKNAHVCVLSADGKASGDEQVWQARIKTKHWGELVIETTLSGRHNIGNIAQVVACLGTLMDDGALSKPITAKALAGALRSFGGVKRRLDHLGSVKGIDIYEDFAHHPTAIRLVIDGFRRVFPDRRLVVAFEPRNATSRRNVFQDDFAASLSLADQVLIGKCPVDERIPAAERMNTKAMEQSIGAKAKAFDDNDVLLSSIAKDVRPGDAVIFMSSGSFSGVQYKLPTLLQNRFG